MQKGTLISGMGHAGLILWVVLGDWLFARKDAPAVEVAEVSLISAAEFDAMVAAAPSTPTPAPEAPVEAPVEAPSDPAPTPPAAPSVTPPAPVRPELPPPVAEPEPAPETLPENNGVADAQLLPVNPDPVPPTPLPPTSSPRPRPAPRVAPVPVEAPEPQAEIAEAPQEAVTPDPVEAPDQVEPERPAAQQQEAGTVLETEANRDEVVEATGAPQTSPRPRGRPARQQPATPPQTAAAQTPPAEPATTDPLADAIAGAVAEAAQDTLRDAPTGGARNAPQGPPMTSGERDALRVAVQQCWNVGSLSSDALRTTVVVFVSVGQNGVPDAASIRMIDSSGGSDAGARSAFDAARRAIIRCGARGFPLPAEKYEQWREMELVFNPDGMRMR